MIDYVPLHQHSTNSSLDGAALHPELAARCVELGHAACALTDHGVVTGHFAFDREMRKVGVKPIFGVEAYLVPDLRERGKAKGERREGEVKAFGYSHLTVLARTQKGYQNLLRLTTISHREGFYYKARIDPETLFRHQAGLTVLSGCVIGEASKLVNLGREEEAFEWLRWMSQNLDSFFVELVPCPGLPISESALPWLVAMATELNLPLVASDDSHFVQPEDFAVQDTLLCVNTGQKVRGERKIQLPDLHYRCSGEEVLARLLVCLPAVPEEVLWTAVERSAEVAAACEEVELPRGRPPVFQVPSGLTAEALLQQAAREGLWSRLQARDVSAVDRTSEADAREYSQRLQRELATICGIGLANYLLVVWDLAREMRARGILVVPRGSAGGCLVLWALGVTVVDPIEHNLPFERFCDENKRDLDIDLDFQHDRRAEAFEYLEMKYGAENCAHVANVVTFGARQALLDAGKVLEAPEGLVAALAHLVPEGESQDAGLHDVGVLKRLFESHPTARKILRLCPDLAIAARLEGHVRNTSIHAGGFLVSARPIHEVTALMGKEGEAKVASLTKDEAAALGLLKIDILGSKTLTAVAETLRELGQSPEWLYALPLEDQAAFALMAEGKNLGLFQIQGTAAGRIMRDLQPKTFEDFTAISAMARPGPLQSGGVKRFVDRARGREEPPPLHPLLEPILGRTQGVLLYQEQVMALAAAAGFPIADVQKLRKVVSKVKGADEMDPYFEPFALGLLERGVSLAEVEDAWTQVLKAGNYLFCECLTGDTIVERPKSNKGGPITIEELYQAQASKTPWGNKIRCGYLTLLQRCADGRIRPGRMKAIYYKGQAEVFRLKTEGGREIRATRTHRFLTSEGYHQVCELSIGNHLVVKGKKEERSRRSRENHPCTRFYDPQKPYRGGFKRGELNPAWKNGLSTKLASAKAEVKERARNCCELCGRRNAGRWEIAHIQKLEQFAGDYLRFHSAENLKHLCQSCHKKLDYQKGERPGKWAYGYPTELDTITSIEPCGVEDVYDIEMLAEEHNFIANGIVSHNSHAVQYAFVGSWTAYLKAHHPAIYTAALARNMSAKADETEEERQFALLREFVERSGRVELLDPRAGPSFRATGEWSLVGGWANLRGVGAKLAAKMSQLPDYESWVDLLADPQVPSQVRRAVTALGLATSCLDADAIERFAPWFPSRPLTCAEVDLANELRTTRLAVVARAKWSDRAETLVLGRVTQVKAIDLAQQFKKYGGTAPRPGETEKARLVLTDEEGSVEVGFSARAWKAHRAAGFRPQVGDTVAGRIWRHEELGRWYAKRAEVTRRPPTKDQVDTQ